MNRVRRFAFAAALWVASATASVVAQDDAAFDKYLERLGLTELRIAHAEEWAKRRQSTAVDEIAAERKRLVNLYLRWLNEASGDEKTYDRAKKKAEEFLAKNPSVKTPEIELILIETNFDQIVNQFIEAVDRPKTGTSQREEAHNKFTAIAASLAEKITQFDKEIEAELAKEVPPEGELPFSKGKFGPKTGEASPAAVDPIVAKEKLRARARYFAGWSHYYAAVSMPQRNGRTKLLETARRYFCQLIDLDHEEESLRFKPEDLQLDNVFRARSLQMIGMIGVALGDRDDAKDDEARASFAALEEPATAGPVRQQLANIRLQAYWNAGRDTDAVEIAQKTLDRLPKSPMPGTASMCAAAIRHGQAESPERPGELSDWTKLGLSGLLRLNAIEDAGALIARYNIDLSSTDEFQLLRLYGKQAFAEAEKSKSNDHYKRAKAALEKGLGTPEAATDPDAAADARFTLAWTLYRLNEFQSAERNFLQASRVLKRSKDPRAVQATWMAVSCANHRASEKQPGATEEARRILLDLKRDFPDSDEAKKVDYLLSKLGKADVPAGNIDELRKVAPGSPNYLDARFDLCNALIQKYRSTKAEDRETLRNELAAVADEFLTKAPTSQSERRVRAGLIVVETLSDNYASPQVATMLKRIDADVKKLEPGSPAVIEWNYRLMQKAIAEKDAAGSLDRAKEIARSGRGTNFELPALIVMAQRADQELASADAGRKRELTLAAIDTYGRIVALMGDDEETLKSKKNAFAANVRLAQYLADVEKWGDAAERFTRALAVAPKDATVLRMAALCQSNARAFEKALPLWQRLLNAHRQDSPEWLEAKYHQIVCLTKTDIAGAKAAYKQFKLLYPEIKDREWQSKFVALEKQLAG